MTYLRNWNEALIIFETELIVSKKILEIRNTISKFHDLLKLFLKILKPIFLITSSYNGESL